jgi:succinate dehydrogenase/fumarate reductase flavoprotein subunit
MGIHGNPFFEHLARLRRDKSATGPPKRPADFQWYMCHTDFKEGVSERFLEEHGDKPKEQHIALRCQVAKAMLEEESEEVQSQIKAECDAAHAEDLEAYKEGGGGLPDANPEAQRQ